MKMGQRCNTVMDPPEGLPTNPYRTPAGMRNIRVMVPEVLFQRLHVMAKDSGMSFIHYMNRFGRSLALSAVCRLRVTAFW